MCGIAGYFSLKEAENSTSSIYRMNRVQKHRGPDDSGLCSVDLINKKLELIPDRDMELSDFVQGFMGFRRLSILDVSQNGHQPMLDKRRKAALTFNGEIYNAFDFKEGLKRGGHEFSSQTDTEVILALYLKYGIVETAKKLNGMFAFALFDMEKQALYLVRDRFGIKPLYYSISDDRVLYASELKSFVVLDDFQAKLNKKAFQECAVFGYCYGKTLLEGVEELRPGSILEYNFNKKSYSTKIYFNLDEYRHPFKPSCGKKAAKKELERKLEKAVQRQTISDVQLGCQLSGGVDSSLTSYFAVQHEKRTLDGISVIFNRDKYNNYSEEMYIDEAAEKTGIKVHKAELTGEYFINHFMDSIWYLDAIPKFYHETGIFLLAQEARKYVTVLLSGEGSDELLCGYDWMCCAYSGKGRIGDIYEKLRKKVYRYGDWYKERARTYENHILFAADALPEKICKKLILEYEDENVCEDRKELLASLNGSEFDKQVKYEMLVRLPALFNRQDKMTMAASIENRVPFLDNDFVEFAFSLPKKYLVKFKPFRRQYQGKYLLKEVCSDIFGREFAFRKKKGFPVPVADFMKNTRFKEMFYSEILPGIERRKLLNATYINGLYQSIDTLEYWEVHALFLSISLEIWLSFFIDKKGIEK